MLQVIEQTPTRLVLKDQRFVSGVVAGIFTALSVGSLLMIAYQGVESLFMVQRDLIGWRIFGFALFLAFGVAFTLLGVMAYQHFMKGITLILDKNTETMYLQSVNIFRLKETTRSIYGVSHIEVETDDRMRVYALFVVLRSGEKLPLAAMSTVDEEHMEHVVSVIRGFLRA